MAKQQTLPIVMGNDKHSILKALISSNEDVWGKFHMHPLKTNMRLATEKICPSRGSNKYARAEGVSAGDLE
jgi:hypothetical protein